MSAETAYQPAQVIPFTLNDGAFRGRIARLDPVVTEVLAPHDYPRVVARMLGEAVALSVLLSNSLKYDGIFTLQTQGDGPIDLMVSDVTSGGDVRGYARFDEDKLNVTLAELDAQGMSFTTPHLLGAGHLAFTVDQGPHTDRYQGVVPLLGKTIDEVAHHYFKQSEQLETAFRIVVSPSDDGSRWHAGALMIQRLPAGGKVDDRPIEDIDEDWRTALVLLSSLKDAELIDPLLPPTEVLRRLFHGEGVEIYPETDIQARCRCSAEKVENTLKSFPREEIESMKVDGVVSVTCEFCKSDYIYETEDLDRLYKG